MVETAQEGKPPVGAVAGREADCLRPQTAEIASVYKVSVIRIVSI